MKNFVLFLKTCDDLEMAPHVNKLSPVDGAYK